MGRGLKGAGGTVWAGGAGCCRAVQVAFDTWHSGEGSWALTRSLCEEHGQRHAACLPELRARFQPFPGRMVGPCRSHLGLSPAGCLRVQQSRVCWGSQSPLTRRVNESPGPRPGIGAQGRAQQRCPEQGVCLLCQPRARPETAGLQSLLGHRPMGLPSLLRSCLWSERVALPSPA